MLFEIKSRWSGEVIFKLETDSLKLCVEAAVNPELTYTELTYPKLTYTELTYTKLTYPKLTYTELT
jgi:hypothetical protein